MAPEKTQSRLSKCNQPQDSFPNIAIVIPVYNVARYLPECLDSILSQTYENFTVFAVDDGATDDSGKILDEYAAGDPRIKVTHKPNGGVSSARNAALEQIEAAGHFDYVCFIDPDDYISRFYLERFVSLVRQYRPGIAFCGFQAFDKTGLLPEHKTLPKSANPYNRDALISRLTSAGEWADTYASNSGLCNLMISSDILLGERFDQSISNAEDTLFNLQITLKANTSAYVDEILYFYRQRKGSLVRNKDKTPSALVFCERFFDFPEQVRPFLANIILSLTRSSIRASITQGVKIPHERVQRIIEFAKKHLYKTKYDEKHRRKYKKMIAWPHPLFLFYLRYIRKDTANASDKLDLFD